jgi:hypothetical protein
MARVPGLEPVKSRLTRAITPEMATLLYRCFLLDRVDALVDRPEIALLVAFTPAAGLRRMQALLPAAVSLRPQEGRDLGARVYGLLAGLLADGHPGAIAMDSDSPTLPVEHVLEAAAILERRAADVVLGPAEDGGYYLIGIRGRHPVLFQDIPWSTDQVLERTLEIAARQGLRTHLLPEWFDVDTGPDLRRLREDLRGRNEGPPRTRRWLDAFLT